MDKEPSIKFYKSATDEKMSKLSTASNQTITFDESYKNYCVGIVDIVGSTKITATLSTLKMCPFYSVFLNEMSLIIKKYGGTVIKNLGDSLLYYFPKTFNSSDRSSFVDPLECGIKMIDANRIVNSKMSDEGLPYVNYRISSDYGLVMTAKSENSFNEDIFGPTVNLCVKINKLAMPNSMVIGGDLHQIVKSFEEYRFDVISEYNNGLKLHYPIYSIKRNIS
ncbi:MAG TPA: adenylate/guanylate cyclase domain-containing protein [Nitrosopumilaceae archaeon]|nr:adenylate/guanylate cyclase domain-containing protein [Nitrosopumilaceae archaeon]